MKKLLCILLTLVLLAGCTAAPAQTTAPKTDSGVQIRLSDQGIEFPADSGIHISAGTGCTVVNITRPGTYRVTGRLSAGQLIVDLGENAQDDPNALVTLILDNAEILCRRAPAVIFRNVYECGEPNAPGGANVVLAEGSVNRVVGGCTEEYDGAFYSRMSMTVSGSGSLSLEGSNEGLCSEMHLTMDGGSIAISSGNDGINANADGIGVITINDGRLWIAVAGATGEGDGIDSNGSVVINGGHVEVYAHPGSMDSGIDADLGIRLNGGTVISTGNMPDPIEGDGQTFAAFTFSDTQNSLLYTLKDAYGSTVIEGQTPCAFTNLLFSCPQLTAGTYTLWSGDTQYEGQTGVGGGFGLIQPIEPPNFPGKGEGGDVEIPPQPTQPIVTYGTGQPPAQGNRPADMPVPHIPQDGEGVLHAPPIPPGSEDMPMPELPEGVTPDRHSFDRQPIPMTPGVLSTDFAIVQGENYFSHVRAVP